MDVTTLVFGKRGLTDKVESWRICDTPLGGLLVVWPFSMVQIFNLLNFARSPCTPDQGGTPSPLEVLHLVVKCRGVKLDGGPPHGGGGATQRSAFFKSNKSGNVQEERSPSLKRVQTWSKTDKSVSKLAQKGPKGVKTGQNGPMRG